MAMTRQVKEILDLLDQHYGTNHRIYLEHENAWQLLIATMLSAQCTDARVNQVTRDLFRKYTSVEAIAKADLKELEQDIHSTGFYHNKAKNMIACCKQLLELHQGEVPSDIESLIALAGVGRKTANVIRGNIFHEPSIVVDTHVKRISKKLGLTKEEDPVKVEFDLMKKLPKDHWILYNIQVIAHGRSICKAPTPKCEICFLQQQCKDYQKRIKKVGKHEPDCH
jgi:endonuclease III